MKYTIGLELSREDLAALAGCAYNPSSFWRNGILQRPNAKPTQKDVRKFVKDAIEEKLRGAYISTGSGRREILEQWKAEE